VTGRAAALQGGLAALGLITAHLTWQREPERQPGEATIFEATKYDVTHVKYEDDGVTTEMSRVKGGDGPEVMLRIEHKTPKPPTGHTTSATDSAPTPPQDFRGSDGAGRVYDKFTPFVAPRAFGALDAGKLKELGLDAPKRKLEVTVRGDTRKFDIGQPTTASTGELFLRDTRDGRVYLFPRGILPELQNADSLIDRRMHTFEPADYDRVVLAVGGKKKELIHKGGKAVPSETFAPAKTPDKPDQMAKNWHDMIWRTFPSEVLGKGETPKGGTPAPALRLDYYLGKDSVGFIELDKVELAPKTTSEEHDAQTQPDYYARTEHTVGWVKIRGAGSQLATDAAKIVTSP
jgi:hypothetical protein